MLTINMIFSFSYEIYQEGSWPISVNLHHVKMEVCKPRLKEPWVNFSNWVHFIHPREVLLLSLR